MNERWTKYYLSVPLYFMIVVHSTAYNSVYMAVHDYVQQNKRVWLSAINLQDLLKESALMFKPTLERAPIQ